MELGIMSVYASIAYIRAANAIFVVSLALTLPELDPAFHGLILASYAIFEALTGLLGGVIYERLGARITLSTATIILAFIYTLMSLNLNPRSILLLNAMAGVIAAIVLVTSLGVLAEGTREKPRIRLFGAGGLEASNLGGYALGFAIAFTLEVLGLLEGFLASAILAFAAFLSSVKAPNARGNRVVLSIERRALKLGPLWLGLGSLIGLAFVSPKIIKETGITIIGLDMGGEASLTLIAGLLSVSAGVIVGSYIASIIGKLAALIIGSIAIPLALVIGGMFIDIILTPKLLPLLVLLAIPAMTLPPAMLALLADYTDGSKSRGVQMGFYVTILSLGIAFGEFILGGVIFQGLGLTLTAIAAAFLFTVLAVPTVYLVCMDSRRLS